MTERLLELELVEQRDAIASGELNPLELLDAYATHVESTAQKTNAFVALDFDVARNDLQKGMANGALSGIPFAIKDLIHTPPFTTTCASKILTGYHPPFDATAIKKMRDAGAVFYGKLNMDEFAMGSSNENSAYGAVRNPWNPNHAPGGSSGGSAAAVAALQTPATLGSDTGGSIRQPAAFCGITGLKPTYGRVSRYGLVAFASSLDQIGPMGRSARDCALLLEVISGVDTRDGTTVSQEVPQLDQVTQPLEQGLRVGLPSEYFGDGLDPAIADQIETFKTWLSEQGATLVPVDLPHTRYIIATYYLIATAEASANLARFDGVRYGHRTQELTDGLEAMYTKTRGEGFGAEVKRRIMLGTFALSSGYYDAYYGKAQRVRDRIRQDFHQAFEEVDLLLTPTTPTTAFPLGDKLDDPLQMYLSDIYTGACNLAGLPGLSIPCGFDQTNLPIAAQLIGPAWSEALLLRVAHAFQQETDYHKQVPQMAVEAYS